MYQIQKEGVEWQEDQHVHIFLKTPDESLMIKINAC